jgi:hypothetical protein
MRRDYVSITVVGRQRIYFGKSFNTWDYYAHDQSQLDRANMANPPSFNNFADDPNFKADQNKKRPRSHPAARIFQL